MSPYRILIVDDQRDVRRVLRAALETLGPEMKITDVPSGEEAILVISRQPVDLLITDVRLPGISGLELKERATVRNPEMSLIMITGMTEPKVRQEVVNAGVDAYFFKPIEMGAFLDAVRRLLPLDDRLLPVDSSAARPTAGAPAAPQRAQPSSAAAALPAFAGKTSPASPPVAAAARSPHNLAGRLSDLRSSLRAQCALLIDDRGEVIAQAGVLPVMLPVEVVLPQLGTITSVATRLSLQLGARLPRDWMVFPGDENDLFVTHIGQNVGLVLVTANGVWEGARIGELMQQVRQGARDLLEMLADWGVPLGETPIPSSAGGPQPAPSQPAAAPEPVAAEELDALLPDLDAIFGGAHGETLKTLDADAFWESAVAADPGEKTLRADALSYDQARQLGLAPDEK
ncbi:MAG: response regulator [Chloroflexota bacterium]